MERIKSFLRRLGRNRVHTQVEIVVSTPEAVARTVFTASILLTPSLALQIPDAWKSLEEDPSVTDATSRVIYTGQGAGNVQSPFCGNEVHTAKYNTASFVPIFLFTMFSRVAYLYFLTQCALAYWSTISPFSPYGPTIALCFVLGVAAIKAIVEDKKRHDEDRRTNNATAHVLQDDGSTKNVRWRNVQVGQILEVRDKEDFPADLLCLSCTRSDGIAYIRTTNLDAPRRLADRLNRLVRLEKTLSLPEAFRTSYADN